MTRRPCLSGLVCALLLAASLPAHAATRNKAAAKPVPAPAAVAAPAPIPAPVPLFAGATFMLPQGARIGPRWILPPTSVTRLGSGFAVLPDDSPVISYDDSTLMFPARQYLVSVDRELSGLAALDNGVLVLSSGKDLGLLATTRQPSTDKRGVPIVAFQPIVALPVDKIDVLASAGNTVYGAGRNAEARRYQVYRLRSAPGAGLQDLELAYESGEPITAIAADDEALFVALGRQVMRVSARDGGATLVYASPSAAVTDLAITPAGVIVSTGQELVLVGPNGTLVILRSQGQRIAARGAKLYLFFQHSLGVLALDNLADLQRFNLDVRPVTPAEQAPALTITSVGFFESGPPPYPQYSGQHFAGSFDRTKIRSIVARIEWVGAAMPGPVPHTVTVSWYAPNNARILSTNYPALLARGVGGGVVMAAIGGKTEHGYSPPHWAGQMKFTDSLAAKYPGRYRVRVDVDGVPASEAFFTITGTTTPWEMLAVDDIAALEAQLNNGLSARSKDKDGDSLLSLALRWGSTAATELLLRKGATASESDKGGDPPLDALLGGPLRLDWQAKAEALIRHGANVNAPVGKNGDPLIQKVWDPAVALFLLRHGADVNRVSKFRGTALDWVVGSHNMCTPEIIAELVNRGANVNAMSQTMLQGNYPLGIALTRGNEACVALLLANGARLDPARRHQGEAVGSALFVALELLDSRVKNHDQDAVASARRIVELLLAKGAVLRPVETWRMFTKEGAAFFDAATMGQALDREAVLPESHMGLRYARESADPAIREVLLRHAMGQIRKRAAAATSKSELGGALQYCDIAYQISEAQYQPLQLDVVPQVRPAGQGTGSWIGAALLPREQGGTYVGSVVSDTSAARAGLRLGDILLAFDTQEIKDVKQAVAIISGKQPGVPVRVTFLRDDPMRLPDLQLSCGLVEHEHGDAMGKMNLTRWLAANPQAQQAQAVQELIAK